MAFGSWFSSPVNPAPSSPGASPADLSARMEYVDALLALMLKRTWFHMRLSGATALPNLDGEDGRPLPVPGFPAVVNRLKVLARLNPMIYAKPVAGTIEVRRGSLVLVYTVAFDDKADPPTFEIKLGIRNG